ALAACAAALLGWYARRRPAAIGRGRWGAIVGLMAMSVAAVLVLLLNPTWVRPVPPPAGRPLITVLVDATASMATPDGGRGAAVTRFAAAVEMARALEAKLAGGA